MKNNNQKPIKFYVVICDREYPYIWGREIHLNYEAAVSSARQANLYGGWAKVVQCECQVSERWIEWIEPFGPNSEPVFCRVPESTAVATQRHTAQGLERPYTYATDEDALVDFMAVHWAEFVRCEVEGK
jgi:hypothetical protein